MSEQAGVIQGAGENSLDGAEQQALQQGIRNGSTVEPYKKFLTAGAGVVDALCQHLLAGPGLPIDQHGAVGLGRLLRLAHQPFHDRAGIKKILEGVASAVHHALVPAFSLHLLLQVDVLVNQVLDLSDVTTDRAGSDRPLVLETPGRCWLPGRLPDPRR